MKNYFLNLTRWWFESLVVTATTLFFVTFSWSGAGRYFEENITRSIEFRFRAFFGLEPQLSDRIKIYAFDDHTVSTLSDYDLPIKLWGKILADLAKTEPKLILIDKVFSTPRAKDQAPEFLELMKSVKVPVAVGSFVSANQIDGRPMLHLNHDDFNLRSSLHVQNTSDQSKEMSKIDWFSITTGYPYGPDESVSRGFNHVGHIIYEGHGTVKAFLRLDKEHFIPHLTLFAAEKILIKDGKFWVNDHPIKIDPTGSIPVNFIGYESIRRQTYSLKNVVLRSLNNESQEGSVAKGQVIVILPGMYSGGTDWVDTPFGKRPGSHVILSMLNSILLDSWLSFSGYESLMIFVAGLLGTLISSLFSTFASWFLMITSCLLVIFAGLLTFAFGGVILPWSFMVGAILVAGITTFIRKTFHNEIRNAELKAALHGVMSQDQLSMILKNPKPLSIEPVGRVVTIMFVDIVGFSMTAERLTSQDVFALLKQFLGELVEIIHQHGGIVDKTLGDGLLVFFGYNLADKAVSTNHADDALKCAIALQNLCYKRILEGASQKSPLFPLRIGLNTALVHIGDMGTTKRIDITIIGNGVNYANRLEAACEPFRIMMGASTRELIGFLPQKNDAVHRRLIKIKHHHELLDAYEYNPLFDQPAREQEILQAYRQYIKVQRGEERISLHRMGLVKLRSNNGVFQIVNYAKSGYNILGSQYLAKGVVISVHFETSEGAFEEELKSLGMTPFDLEVKWGQPCGEGYHHGVMIISLNDHQKNILLQKIRGYVQSKSLEIQDTNLLNKTARAAS